MRIVLQGLTGEVRARDPHVLGDAAATISRNHKPGRGTLRPWAAPLEVATIPAGRQTIYRMGRDVRSDSQYWLSWTGVVHAMRGFIPDDTTERTFYTGDGLPKQTDNVLGLASAPYPTAWRYLGVPKPVDTPILTALAAGSATDTEIRYYVYTFVTDKGEESAPSPVSLPCSGKTDATWTISNLGTPPAGAYGINRIRIYRTQTGQAGDTEFFFLREVVSTATTSTDDGRALGEVLPTDGWEVPDPAMTNLTPMWNGMAAGIVPGGAVRYCVAYKPYAWPVAYESLPPDAAAVALGRFGQSLLVLTTAKPFLVQGSSPDALQDTPIEFAESCIAPRSVVSLGHGVAWACPDGLAYYGSGGPKLITTGLMDRDDWQAINPSSIVGAAYKGSYVGFYTQAGVRRGFMVDPLTPDGLYFLDTGYEAAFFDELQDSLFVLDSTSIKKWDASATFMIATFRSKVFRSPPTNLGYGRVVATSYPVTVRIDALGLKPATVTKLVAKWGGKLTAPTPTTLRYSKDVTGADPFSIPGGFQARDWQVQIETSNPVLQVAFSNDVRELAEL